MNTSGSLGSRFCLEHVLGVLQRRLQLAPLALGDLVLVLVEVLLHPEHQRLELVARLDGLAPLLVLDLVLLGLLHHPLDVLLVQARGGGDGDVLGLAGGLVLGRHVDDAVGVDVEGDLDLRHAARRRRDALQAELAEQPVVVGHRPLALEHLHLDRGLVVGRGREGLASSWSGWWCCAGSAWSSRRPGSRCPATAG